MKHQSTGTVSLCSLGFVYWGFLGQRYTQTNLVSNSPVKCSGRRSSLGQSLGPNSKFGQCLVGIG